MELKNGYIYAFQGIQTKLIKIGFSKELPYKRLLTAQSYSPDKLKVLGVWKGCRVDETNTHYLFLRYHSHGEWFNESQSLLRYILKNNQPDLLESLRIESLQLKRNQWKISDLTEAFS